MRFFYCFFLITPLAAEPVFTLQKSLGKLQSEKIAEASGLAVSPTNQNFIWFINDSGGTNEIHLVTSDGASRGSVTLGNTENHDWEDISAFTDNGENYLIIADTGDNNSKRKSVTLYIISEPPLPAEGKSITGNTPISWEIDFTFEGGPRDCEAVAVDGANSKILLLTKRTKVPELHELPLHPRGNETLSTRKIGEAKVIAPALTFLPYRNQPTGMDISNSGKMAVVVTYYGVFVFQRNESEDWAQAFARQPLRVGSHHLQQAESVGFSPDGQTIYAVSEGTGSIIQHFQRK